ncbi:alpha/beta fold hydrolase [Nocardia brasiliensis]|uniref:alpha/beta fold hydrolase n=1 Tax=Nocardia brasiliensis TaxID=37326 RepID=UPI0024576B60|nr:alpha/beta hydrolase [Nocardia brasiliensis]
MTNKGTYPADPTWTGTVPVGDTTLAVTDTGGPGTPVLYLNGHVATQKNWRPVIAELGPGWRHITYDMRARGKSGTSADYSFETNVADVDAVLAARGVQRVLVIGWSYGAFVAAYWASRNPDRTVGAVLVEGAQPHDWIDGIDVEGMRRLWRRLGWLMPLMRMTGRGARMTAEQMADSNIEAGEIARERVLGPVMDNIRVPTRYVNASGASFGSKGDEQERIRASLHKVVERNPNIEIFAKVSSSHGSILRKDYRTIADAVRVVAALDGGQR